MTAITIALALIVGALLMSIYYHRKTIDILKDSIGEMSRASEALAEAKLQGAKRLQESDREFENAVNGIDSIDPDDRH